jgi:hypothetical protein
MAAPAKSVTDNGDGTVTVTKTCVLCSQDAAVIVPAEAYAEWDDGRGPFLQDLMPGVSADIRETLISGSHGSCFDAFFPDDEDDI